MPRLPRSLPRLPVGPSSRRALRLSTRGVVQVGLLVAALSVLMPAAPALAASSRVATSSSTCTNYVRQFEAMFAFNERLVARYEAAGAQESQAAQSSAQARPERQRASRASVSVESDALLSLQHRLAARSLLLIEEMEGRCVVMIDPIAPLDG